MTEQKIRKHCFRIGSTTLGERYGMLMVNGKYYTQETIDGRQVFVLRNQKDIQNKISLSKRLTDKLKDNLDRDKILMESLMKLDIKDLKKLEQMLFKAKRKYKPKTRADACVDMKIGNFILPIVE